MCIFLLCHLGSAPKLQSKRGNNDWKYLKSVSFNKVGLELRIATFKFQALTSGGHVAMGNSLRL